MPVWMIALLVVYSMVATVLVYLMGLNMGRAVRRLEWVRGYVRCPKHICKNLNRKCHICVRRSCIDMFEEIEGDGITNKK